MMLLLWYVSIAVFPVLTTADTEDDVFTSVASVRKLILIEREYGQKLWQLKRNLTLAYDIINKYIAEFRSVPLEDPHLLSKDPIFTFQLVRRLGLDYRILTETLRVSIPDSLLTGVVMPSREDVSKSAIQLIQLQAMYNLSSANLSLGKIVHFDSYIRLKAADMIILHENLEYSMYGYNEDTKWRTIATYYLLYEAGVYDNHVLRKVLEGIERLYKEEVPPPTPSEDQTEENQSPDTTMNETEKTDNITGNTGGDVSGRNDNTDNDTKNTENKFEKISSLVISSTAMDNLTLSAAASVISQAITSTKNTTVKKKKSSKPIKPFLGFEEEGRDMRYMTLCNGIKLMTPEEEADLYCQVTTLKQPEFILKRVKREMLCRTPPIFLFHDFLRNQEADLIKMVAEDKLYRSMIVDFTSPTGTSFSHSRISKTAWLMDEDHPTVKEVSRRVGMVTGLVTNKTDQDVEEFQVVNYGLGGEYYFHWDDSSEKDDLELLDPEETGGRLATFLIFLEDVEIGGHTVFPDLGIFVKPKKGSALLWYNLFLNGSVDGRTVHGGCPVLYGSKWISNKWILYKSQVWKRPCGLSQDDEHSFLES